MRYTITLHYYLKRMFGSKDKNKWKELEKGLSEAYGPSDLTLNNIRRFADAYEHKKSTHVGHIEYLKN